MNDTVVSPAPKPRRARTARSDGSAHSGSETRQRGSIVPFRVNASERADLEAAADRAGLSLGSYIRARVLTAPTTRATRTPPVNKVALAKLLGEIGRIGGNVNQIARQLNSGRDPQEVANLQHTLRSLWQMRDAVLMALGMKASTDERPATVTRE